MNIESRLREEIAGCGLSYREIARRAGVTLQVVVRFRDGGCLRTDKADKLCSVFGLKLTKESEKGGRRHG